MSLITEQVKRLRSEAAGMILQNGTTARLLREAADTIEQLAAKVREDNAYQKAFEDIMAEIKILPNANPSYWYSGDMVERREVLEIIDEHIKEYME